MTERSPFNRRSKPLPEPYLARLQKRVSRGLSLEEAAQEVGLTLPLARSVFIRSGLPVPKPMRRRAPLADPGLGRRIHDHLRRLGGATTSEVAESLGVTQVQVRSAVWDEDRSRLRPRPTLRDIYSDTAILIGLQLMAYDRGRRTAARGPVPVSAQWWDEHRDPAAHPAASEVVKRFGSWWQACTAAGIPTGGRIAPRRIRRTWSEEELDAVLREFFARGPAQSPADYQEWAAEREDAPSLQTALGRRGRWTELRARYSV